MEAKIVELLERSISLTERAVSLMEEMMPMLETRIGPRLLKRKGKGVRVSAIYPCPRWAEGAKLLSTKDGIYPLMDKLEVLIAGRNDIPVTEIHGLVTPTQQSHSSKLMMTDAMKRLEFGRADIPDPKGGKRKVWRRLRRK